MKIEIDLDEYEWARAYEMLELGCKVSGEAWSSKGVKKDNPYVASGKKLMQAIKDGMKGGPMDLDEAWHKEMLDRFEGSEE